MHSSPKHTLQERSLSGRVTQPMECSSLRVEFVKSLSKVGEATEKRYILFFGRDLIHCGMFGRGLIGHSTIGVVIGQGLIRRGLIGMVKLGAV